MTTPHTSVSEGSSGDSVAAPRISDERLAALIDTYISPYDEARIGPVVLREINSALRELRRLRSASQEPRAAVATVARDERMSPVEGVAKCEACNNGGNWTGITWTTCGECHGTGKAPAAPPSVEAPTGEKV